MSATEFDIILTGAGAAGLNLALAMQARPELQQHRVLLLDKSDKTANDRTWSFWWPGDFPFEGLRHYVYDRLQVRHGHYDQAFTLAPYRFYSIEAKDFYAYAKDRLGTWGSLSWQQAEVVGWKRKRDAMEVGSTAGQFSAPLVFNSLPTPAFKATLKADSLFQWQHFLGWVIRTEKPSFAEDVATWFDFDTPKLPGQERQFSFMYVLPKSPTEALVEYTFFGQPSFSRKDYVPHLREYITNRLGIENYEMVSEEIGKIPMCGRRLPMLEHGQVHHLGTAGGMTKASTGFTFRNTYLDAQCIADSLAHGGPVKRHRPLARHRHYDRTLLHLLNTQPQLAERSFVQLFQRNPVQRMLRFLDEATTPGEELQLMSSTPRWAFTKAFFKQLWKR